MNELSKKTILNRKETEGVLTPVIIRENGTFIMIYCLTHAGTVNNMFTVIVNEINAWAKDLLSLEYDIRADRSVVQSDPLVGHKMANGSTILHVGKELNVIFSELERVKTEEYDIPKGVRYDKTKNTCSVSLGGLLVVFNGAHYTTEPDELKGRFITTKNGSKIFFQGKGNQILNFTSSFRRGRFYDDEVIAERSGWKNWFETKKGFFHIS